MPAAMVFADVVEAADQLSVEEQETLVEILQQRLREHRREQLLRTVEESRAQFARGECKPMTVEEIMREVTS